MSVISKQSSADRVIVRNVSWTTYESLLKDLDDHRGPRLAYDRGILEIMSPFIEHENINWILASIVDLTLAEMDVDSQNVGMTTFKKEAEKRGFEADSSFYIRNVDRIRGKKRLDMSIDPPPDLVIEVDVTNDSLNKFPLYASLKVPEVWRFRDALEIWILEQGTYFKQPVSKAIPILTDGIISRLLESGLTSKRTVWLRESRATIRAFISATS